MTDSSPWDLSLQPTPLQSLNNRSNQLISAPNYVLLKLTWMISLRIDQLLDGEVAGRHWIGN
jgi:hypothetical protein